MSDKIDSSDMELALAEIRYRPDFVVCCTREVDGVRITKRTPPLTYWKSINWASLYRTWDREHEIEVEIRPVTREAMQLPQLKCIPAQI